MLSLISRQGNSTYAAPLKVTIVIGLQRLVDIIDNVDNKKKSKNICVVE